MPATKQDDKIRSRSRARDNNNAKKAKFKKDLKQLAIFSVIYVPIMALVIGTLEFYFPDPLPLAWGLYFDVGLAISSIALPFYLLVTGIIFLK